MTALDNFNAMRPTPFCPDVGKAISLLALAFGPNAIVFNATIRDVQDVALPDAIVAGTNNIAWDW